VVLDIETAQAPKEEWAMLAGIDLAAPEDLLGAGEAAQQDKEYERSSFDGTFSRIICIGVIAFTDAMEPQGAVAWYGADEAGLLRQFWDWTARARPALFITHNGLGFDLPFIKKRSIIHQVKPTVEINLAKFRTEPVYDTLAVWSNWETRGWVKLDVLARALGVETKSGSGKQVAEMWRTGRGKEIAEYCLQDCYVTYACYSKMTFRDLLPSAQVLAKKDLIEV
jgi:DNA polymerase elongation subunit (family B)